jgi:large subunit ribosomal protein L17
LANRKLGKKTDIRMSMLKTLATDLIMYGKIKTTEARAKEVKKIVDSIIALAVKEKDNFEMVDKKVSRVKLDSNNNKVTETVKSKNGNSYDRVVREVVTVQAKQDKPSRLAARRTIMKNINKVKDEKGNNIDLPTKMFDELAPKYAKNNGGYTRIIKLGKRRGDAAEEVILQLV